MTQSYAASEAAPFSHAVSAGRLHLNSDWFLTEPIDAAGQPVPPRSRSDALLVTNLANYVQPVIRYQLGDSVVVSNEPCQCGPDAITLHLAPELPQVNPRSGKLRYVLKMLPPASTTTPAART